MPAAILESMDMEEEHKKASYCCCSNKKCLCRCCIFLLVAFIILIVFFIVLVIIASVAGDEDIENDTYFTKKGIALPDVNKWAVNGSKAVEDLAAALRYRTISYGDERDSNLTDKLEFLAFLKQRFPLAHGDNGETRSNFTLIPPYNASILFTVAGSDSSLNPYLVIAHYDVVPVPNLALWSQDPFSGARDDRFLYGRGTLDVKGSLMAVMTALEDRLAANATWRPRRTLMIFSGHDEEIGGHAGAKNAATWLNDRGISLEFLLDEGYAVIRRYFPGVERDVAVIGVSEKGYASVEVEVTGVAGHSSIPPNNATIPNLGRAIVSISERPMPFYFSSDDVSRRSFELLAPYFPFSNRFLLRNIPVFKPFVKAYFETLPEVNAQSRTTTAMTIVQSGVKDNILPRTAKLLINHRLHPRDTLESVLAWDRESVEDLEGARVRFKSDSFRNESPPVSPFGPDDAAYHVVKGAVHATFPEAVVAPSITVGGTDSKHFVGLTKNIYRFVPMILDGKEGDTRRIHGINERIRKDNVAQMVQFYHALLELADHI